MLPRALISARGNVASSQNAHSKRVGRPLFRRKGEEARAAPTYNALCSTKGFAELHGPIAARTGTGLVVLLDLLSLSASPAVLRFGRKVWADAAAQQRHDV